MIRPPLPLVALWTTNGDPCPRISHSKDGPCLLRNDKPGHRVILHCELRNTKTERELAAVMESERIFHMIPQRKRPGGSQEGAEASGTKVPQREEVGWDRSWS